MANKYYNVISIKTFVSCIYTFVMRKLQFGTFKYINFKCNIE